MPWRGTHSNPRSNRTWYYSSSYRKKKIRTFYYKNKETFNAWLDDASINSWHIEFVIDAKVCYLLGWVKFLEMAGDLRIERYEAWDPMYQIWGHLLEKKVSDLAF